MLQKDLKTARLGMRLVDGFQSIQVGVDSLHQEEEFLSWKLYYPRTDLESCQVRQILGSDIFGTVTKKANSSLVFFRRNMSRTTKAQCYESLVRPTLEYSSSVWDLYTQENIPELEAVQRMQPRAARFVVGNYRYTSCPSQMMAVSKTRWTNKN